MLPQNIALVLGLAILAGCANPLNEATADRYAAVCASAEAAGNLAVAEQACERGVRNADWGNLSPELKSQYLYNAARVKRRLAKFSEAEALLKESLAIEETLSGPVGVKVGRRLVELSATLAAQAKWGEGEATVLRVVPMALGFAGGERGYTKEVFMAYAAALSKSGRIESANVLRMAAAAL